MTTTPAPVIFDMDGALLRLEVDIEEVRLALAALFRPHGVTRPFRPILGRIEAAAREAGAQGGDEAALRRRGLDLLDAWETRAASEARARDGAAQVLRELGARGHALGLLTHRGRASLDAALTAAGLSPGAFARTVTRDEAPAKPAPDGLIALARALPGDPVWYVVDHAADVATARAAREAVPGLRVVALPGVAGADRSIPDLRALLDVL